MAEVDMLKRELERRVQVLPQELAAWKASVEANREGQGIHQSQVIALEELMSGLADRQSRALESLPAALGPALADAYLGLIEELTGAGEIWQLFRLALAQRRDPPLAPLLDAADLVAADCYRACLGQASNWQAIGPERRAPPLVLLEATTTPVTAGRGEAFATLGFPMRRYRDLRLPLPIVLLPADHAPCFWLFCSIHHEVGHSVDQDLGLSKELKQRLLTYLDEQGIPADRRDRWWSWTAEILADAVGVALGGAGYGQFLASWLLVLAPSPRFEKLDPSDPHPNPHLRTKLLCELMRCLEPDACEEVATRSLGAWEAQPRPDWLPPYASDAALVARFFLETPLRALSGHAVRELGGDTRREATKHANLGQYLRTRLDPPDPALHEIRHRAVPPAAQLALAGAGDLTGPALDDVHQRSLEYLGALPRPKFLAADASRAFYRGLVGVLDFRRGES
jgi:hypothetical protein